MKIKELEQELASVRSSLEYYQRHGQMESNQYAELAEKEAEITAKIDEVKRNEAIEEKVHAEAIPFNVSGVDLDGIPVEMIQFIEEIVKIDRKRILNEHAIELEQMENEKNGRIMSLEFALKEKDEIIERGSKETKSLIHENRDLSSHIEDLNMRLADAESKRDAAVENQESTQQALNEALSEIQRLNGVIAEFEQAAEYKTREDKPIVASAEETTTLQAKADAVKKLFTSIEDWGSSIKVNKPDGTFDLVKRSELESEWEPADVTPPSVEETAIVPQFQEDDDIAGLAGNPIVPEGLQDHDGGETFEQWATREIKALKAAVYGVDANKEAA